MSDRLQEIKPETDSELLDFLEVITRARCTGAGASSLRPREMASAGYS